MINPFMSQPPPVAVALVTKRAASESLMVGRIKVRVIDDGSLNGYVLGMIEARVPPRTEQTPIHRHRRYSLSFLVTSGTLQFTIANGLYRASAGDYITVPVGASYTFSNPFDQPAVFFSMFTPSGFIGYFRDLAELSREGPVGPNEIYAVMRRYEIDPA